MTALEYSDSIVIDASPDAVYALVSDVTRTGEWSPICRECWWNEPGGGQVGSTFTGRNVTPDRTWETVSTVAVADPGREFAWFVGEKFVRWNYTLEPVGESTRLTESWHLTDEGVAFFHTKYGSEAQNEIEIRRAAAYSGIPQTLAAIKAIAEA